MLETMSQLRVKGISSWESELAAYMDDDALPHLGRNQGEQALLECVPEASEL